jgi:hypothetical protein
MATTPLADSHLWEWINAGFTTAEVVVALQNSSKIFAALQRRKRSRWRGTISSSSSLVSAPWTIPIAEMYGRAAEVSNTEKFINSLCLSLSIGVSIGRTPLWFGCFRTVTSASKFSVSTTTYNSIPSYLPINTQPKCLQYSSAEMGPYDFPSAVGDASWYRRVYDV